MLSLFARKFNRTQYASGEAIFDFIGHFTSNFYYNISKAPLIYENPRTPSLAVLHYSQNHPNGARALHCFSLLCQDWNGCPLHLLRIPSHAYQALWFSYFYSLWYSFHPMEIQLQISSCRPLPISAPVVAPSMDQVLIPPLFLFQITSSYPQAFTSSVPLSSAPNARSRPNLQHTL